jgi:hypothetical protein
MCLFSCFSHQLIDFGLSRKIEGEAMRERLTVQAREGMQVSDGLPALQRQGVRWMTPVCSLWTYRAKQVWGNQKHIAPELLREFERARSARTTAELSYAKQVWLNSEVNRHPSPPFAPGQGDFVM